MRIRKAVITAAGSAQRLLPLQVLIDRDGRERSVLAILIEEALEADIEEVCVVVHPGDELDYAAVAGEHRGRLRLVEQREQRGYGHAIWCAREFTGGEPFLHLVGDHLYVRRGERGCAQRLVETASAEECAVSAVHATRESQLPYFGAVGGQRVAGKPGLYRVETVLEKPTPTEAEQRIMVPGLRAGHYLCFFGMHVLTPGVMDALERLLGGSGGRATLSDALGAITKTERYLALEIEEQRYDLGKRYGLFTAQLALALSGRDREEMLATLVEVLASHLSLPRGGGERA
jgi:UTP--glucose-1-phosphate uridylyltransferase